ncbi:uncharacterized protein B0I36DRAFT_325055 [Microdochium trichocladiopsis]|uniref:Uncharacterized protein n=1 Tax=Microdochium trichocladiopsis TaxID=1682393 RepID=A0A9P9BPB8_9PEZI|nr:uncharacterized protein B0I36DRAFT_325055 [Microdochium trichocladiopsis]KAH7029109.1 hypothetical protein B0I36DRAFT_325055 [Microdochium trichocladiopsis]
MTSCPGTYGEFASPIEATEIVAGETLNITLILDRSLWKSPLFYRAQLRDSRKLSVVANITDATLHWDPVAAGLSPTLFSTGPPVWLTGADGKCPNSTAVYHSWLVPPTIPVSNGPRGFQIFSEYGDATFPGATVSETFFLVQRGQTTSATTTGAVTSSAVSSSGNGNSSPTVAANQDSRPNYELSFASQMALVILLPIMVCSLLIVWFCRWLRKKRNQGSTPGTDTSQPVTAQIAATSEATRFEKPELEAPTTAAIPREPQELDSQPVSPWGHDLQRHHGEHVADLARSPGVRVMSYELEASRTQ